jgi:hypothetical protein
MEIQGLVIFVGAIAVYTFFLLGCMERRLKGVARVVKQVEDENAKYVN